MESSLSLNRTDLMRHVARELGWNRDLQFAPDEQADMDDIIGTALRQFYNPPIVNGMKQSHRWSFLRPIGQLVTKENTPDYDMPDDFGGMDGALTFFGDDIGCSEVTKTSAHKILRLRQSSSVATGYPEFYALSALPSDGKTPQRTSLLLYPTPAEEYTLRFAYRSNPYNLRVNAPFPLGGMSAAEALRASAIAAAEGMFNDAQGPRWLEYLTKLSSAVSHDLQETTVRNLGHNGDRSMERYPTPERQLSVTFEGQSFAHEGFYFDN